MSLRCSPVLAFIPAIRMNGIRIFICPEQVPEAIQEAWFELMRLVRDGFDGGRRGAANGRRLAGDDLLLAAK